MKNFAKSEIEETFDEKRTQFTPYGFTCEVWKPKLMNKFDRHNEVEINYVPSGSLTYLIHDRSVTIPAGRVGLFWGLFPHRIIASENVSSYYVVTVPLRVFLKWQLSSQFIDNIMKGGVIIDQAPSELDNHIFRLWYVNLERNKDLEDIVRTEVHCRVRRLEKSGISPEARPITIYEGNIYDYIERMAMYISSNYDKSLTVVKVAESVGLHPDYANAIFRRTFCHPIREHIAMERITRAQHRLLFSSDHISTIAYEVGYETLSSFNRAFKKLTGLTPREYRNGLITTPEF